MGIMEKWNDLSFLGEKRLLYTVPDTTRPAIRHIASTAFPGQIRPATSDSEPVLG